MVRSVLAAGAELLALAMFLAALLFIAGIVVGVIA
jgi:hypothetical protein